MPIINSGWKIVNQYNDLCVGDIVKYSPEVRIYYKKNGKRKKVSFYCYEFIWNCY